MPKQQMQQRISYLKEIYEIGERELVVKKNYRSRSTALSAHRIINIKHFPVLDVRLTISAVGRAAAEDKKQHNPFVYLLFITSTVKLKKAWP